MRLTENITPTPWTEKRVLARDPLWLKQGLGSSCEFSHCDLNLLPLGDLVRFYQLMKRCIHDVLQN